MRRRTSGFTLIETIVYVGLVVLFVLLLVEIMIMMSTTYRKLVLARTLAESGAVAMERMTREIRIADDIDLPGSVLDQAAGRLRLYSSTESGIAQIVSFALENGRVNVYENDVLTGPLTTSHASTTKLQFHLFTDSRSKAIGIEMTVLAQYATEVQSKTFRTTVVLRNSL
jgi:Tfp pilus assembly protein PilW